jgi:ABC-type lipoprotein export system ATPase subunit
VSDVDIWSLSDDDLARFRSREVGFVFQFASLLPTLRVVDNVALPALLGRPRETAAAYRTATQLLDQVGLDECADAYPAEISSGEQRRAVLARALINAPPLLLADEPTSDLDEPTETAIMDWLRALNRSANLTVMMVTHNLRLADQADRVLHIASGSLVS